MNQTELRNDRSIVGKVFLVLSLLGLVISAGLLFPVIQREIIRFSELFSNYQKIT
jgi:hypothetical protein